MTNVHQILKAAHDLQVFFLLSLSLPPFLPSSHSSTDRKYQIYGLRSCLCKPQVCSFSSTPFPPLFPPPYFLLSSPLVLFLSALFFFPPFFSPLFSLPTENLLATKPPLLLSEWMFFMRFFFFFFLSFFLFLFFSFFFFSFFFSFFLSFFSPLSFNSVSSPFFFFSSSSFLFSFSFFLGGCSPNRRRKRFKFLQSRRNARIDCGSRLQKFIYLFAN